MVIAKPMAMLAACVALLLGGWSASCAATPYAHQFPVHRLLQYDLDDSQMGSRKSVMDLMVVTPPLIEKAAAKGTSKKVVPLKRRAAMVRMSDTTKDELSSLGYRADLSLSRLSEFRSCRGSSHPSEFRPWQALSHLSSRLH